MKLLKTPGDVDRNDGRKEIYDDRFTRLYEIDSQIMQDWERKKPLTAIGRFRRSRGDAEVIAAGK